jgi:hypothetical protein
MTFEKTPSGVETGEKREASPVYVPAGVDSGADPMPLGGTALPG